MPFAKKPQKPCHFQWHLIWSLAAFPNKNQEVKEAAIRAFESWGNLESLKILKNISLEEEWLSEYLNEVISDLNEELV